MHLDVWPIEGLDFLSSKTQKWLGCYKGSKWDETWQDWPLDIAEGTLGCIWIFGHQGAKFI